MRGRWGSPRPPRRPLPRVPALLRGVRAGSKLFIVDACRNDVSAAKGGEPTLGTEGFAKAIEVVSRGGGDSGPSPTVTLCSCSEGETSWEWEEQKQGVFTFFLTSGLEGGAADESGLVTVAGLGKYVEEEVGKWCREHRDLTSARAQTPWLKVSGSAGTAQLPLARVRPGAGRRGATAFVAAVLPLHNLTGDRETARTRFRFHERTSLRRGSRLCRAVLSSVRGAGGGGAL